MLLVYAPLRVPAVCARIRLFQQTLALLTVECRTRLQEVLLKRHEVQLLVLNLLLRLVKTLQHVNVGLDVVRVDSLAIAVHLDLIEDDALQNVQQCRQVGLHRSAEDLVAEEAH